MSSGSVAAAERRRGRRRRWLEQHSARCDARRAASSGASITSIRSSAGSSSRDLEEPVEEAGVLHDRHLGTGVARRGTGSPRPTTSCRCRPAWHEEQGGQVERCGTRDGSASSAATRSPGADPDEPQAGGGPADGVAYVGRRSRRSSRRRRFDRVQQRRRRRVGCQCRGTVGARCCLRRRHRSRRWTTGVIGHCSIATRGVPSARSADRAWLGRSGLSRAGRVQTRPTAKLLRSERGSRHAQRRDRRCDPHTARQAQRQLEGLASRRPRRRDAQRARRAHRPRPGASSTTS